MSKRVWKVLSINEYEDDAYVYRHWQLGPRRAITSLLPRRLMNFWEWSQYVTQSVVWEHYALHRPEPNILMFRKPKQARV